MINLEEERAKDKLEEVWNKRKVTDEKSRRRERRQMRNMEEERGGR